MKLLKTLLFDILFQPSTNAFVIIAISSNILSEKKNLKNFFMHLSIS